MEPATLAPFVYHKEIAMTYREEIMEELEDIVCSTQFIDNDLPWERHEQEEELLRNLKLLVGKLMVKKPVSIILLQTNGDPYGSGFVGSQSDDGGHSWYYRGDLGARARWWWRKYCQDFGYAMMEE